MSQQEVAEGLRDPRAAHPHYHKDVRRLNYIDVYRVCELFEVTDSAIAHAVKKLLVAGGRGAGKDMRQDVQEAIDTLLRRQQMWKEDDSAQKSFDNW